MIIIVVGQGWRVEEGVGKSTYGLPDQDVSSPSVGPIV